VHRSPVDDFHHRDDDRQRIPAADLVAEEGEGTMRIRDKDNNTAFCNVVRDDLSAVPRFVVGIHAEGVWLTPRQAERFAAAIKKAAGRVRRAGRPK
jgi:hypothetical protein